MTTRLSSGLRAGGFLALGGAGLAFGQGHRPIPLVLVFGLVCTIRFFCVAPMWVGIPAFTLVHIGVWELAYRGMVPLPLAPRLGMEAGVSLVLALCFAAHAWAMRRSPGMQRTLVLPSALVVFEFLASRFNPGATWGSYAYSLVESTEIVQIASLVGWLGLTFLLAWVASVIAWVWGGGLGSRTAVRGLATIGAVVGVVFAFGVWRTRAILHPEGVRVAAVIPSTTFSGPEIGDLWAYTRGIEQSAESRQRATARIAESLDEHESMIRRAASAGAEFVLCPEASGTLTLAEESEWNERLSALAVEYEVHVGVGLFVFRPSTGELALNKFVLFDPEGRTAIDFLKATRPPGAAHIAGDGQLPVYESGARTVSAAICFDLDFPQSIRQAGRAGADLFLAPSADWREAALTHERMAIMRSVEQGFAMARPTRDGVTVFTDALGRTVARLHLGEGETGEIAAIVPAEGRATLYSRIGDVLGWACALLLLVQLALAGSSRRAVEAAEA